jgi:hypothetical protein
VYTTTVAQVVAADRATVFRALDPGAVARWRVPEGMTGEVHELDARVGGAIRMSLTYDDLAQAGKSGGATDTYVGTEVEIAIAGMPDAVPPEQNEEGTRMSLAALARLVG